MGLFVHPRPRTQNPFRGEWPWSPGGWVSQADEGALDYRIHNLRLPVLHYAEMAVLQHIDHADEYFCPNPYQYIPYQIVGKDVIDANQHANVDPHHPYMTRPPAPGQLSRALYDSAKALWNDLRQQTGTDWGGNG